jgi:hypothetical protein
MIHKKIIYIAIIGGSVLLFTMIKVTLFSILDLLKYYLNKKIYYINILKDKYINYK